MLRTIFFVSMLLMNGLAHSETKEISDLKKGRWLITEMHLQQASKGDILFFGDSLVQGMEMRGINPLPINMGIGGFLLSEITLRMKDVSVNEYRAIIVEGGTNDVFSGRGIAEIKESYDVIFEESAKAKKFYFSQMLPVGNNKYEKNNVLIKSLNAYIKSKCAEFKNCKLIESPKVMWVRDNSHYYLPDAVHLSGLAFIEWKKEINRAISNK